MSMVNGHITFIVNTELFCGCARNVLCEQRNNVILKVQSQANPPAAEAPRLSEVYVNVIVTYGREFHVVMIFDVGSNG